MLFIFNHFLFILGIEFIYKNLNIIFIKINIQAKFMGSDTQNTQRGIMFVWFLFSVIFTIFVIIRLIKNQVDSGSGQGQQKYKQGQKPRAQPNDSQQRFDYQVAKKNAPTNDDTIIQRWIKKVSEFQVLYFPIMIPAALNIVMGTTTAFLVSIFLITKVLFLLFNVWKIHRMCVEHKVLRALLQNVAYFLSFFLLLNVWPSKTSDQPYGVYQA